MTLEECRILREDRFIANANAVPVVIKENILHVLAENLFVGRIGRSARSDRSSGDRYTANRRPRVNAVSGILKQIDIHASPRFEQTNLPPTQTSRAAGLPD